MSKRRSQKKPRRIKAAETARRAPMRMDLLDIWKQITAPQPIARLEFMRIFLPLVILGFFSSRAMHADSWLSEVGFKVPELPAGDWRQPLYLPALPEWGAWTVGLGLLLGCLALSAGIWTRLSAALLCALLFYVALADRLAAFTVSKLSPVLVLALFLSACGSRWSIDAWLARRRNPQRPRFSMAAGGTVPFVQVLLPTFYFSSGVCKARGDWLSHSHVLWTHLHDSYQTSFSYLLANTMPSWSWTIMQGATLAFEAGAPIWFSWKLSRPFALGYGIAMHALIGLMFGPVIWFSLLMIVLLITSYAPAHWLHHVLDRLTPRRHHKP